MGLDCSNFTSHSVGGASDQDGHQKCPSPHANNVLEWWCQSLFKPFKPRMQQHINNQEEAQTAAFAYAMPSPGMRIK
ncbi:hypothetical protein CERZMDRAFT_89524 [Cercospora zeae-maydis SCOH1-5]|uniref:Uncharacterized protein n=1 Tax=Cercospora zeae-maydis SCOH1-5 TaxID=717836 RepID=A0A6A6FVJ4_9PEZI|nr:hypothetical protein CERZMDRAFT_89524 [Cercospora zeae-maydis SCOH1-5]